MSFLQIQLSNSHSTYCVIYEQNEHAPGGLTNCQGRGDRDIVDICVGGCLAGLSPCVLFSLEIITIIAELRGVIKKTEKKNRFYSTRFGRALACRTKKNSVFLNTYKIKQSHGKCDREW